MKQAEFRGCDSFVCAEITLDDKTGYTTGNVVEIAPIASVAKTTDVNSETHFYDNKGLIQIKAVGVDTVTFIVPAMYLSKLAIVTGAYIDPVTGAYMSRSDNDKEYAVGYRLKLTDGTYRYVWRLKGTFSNIPDENSNTESQNIDTQSQTVTFSGTWTISEFSGVGSQREIVMDERDGLCDFTNFFSKVRTPYNIGELVTATTTAIEVSPTTKSIAVGQESTIAATTTPQNNPVAWISSNPNVCTVATASGAPSRYGTVTGKAAGTAVITAVSGNYSASCVVTVAQGA